MRGEEVNFHSGRCDWLREIWLAFLVLQEQNFYISKTNKNKLLFSLPSLCNHLQSAVLITPANQGLSSSLLKKRYFALCVVA